MGLYDESRDETLHRLLRRKRLPVLTLDTRWHEIFPEEMKTEEIRKKEEEVSKYLKLQGKITNEITDYKKVKKRLMENIISNMETTEGEGEKRREKLLDKSRRLIKEAKSKIESLEEDEQDIPEKLKEANEKLMLLSVEEGYKRISENKEEIDELAKWISRVRIELKKKLIIKQEMEDENALIYSNMHDMLGPELMEFFDEEYGDDI